MDKPTRQQTTIANAVSVSGYGFWSGRDVTLEFRPAPANSNITFVRTDLPGQPRIPAVIQNRVNGPRRTTLVAHGCPVEMVEHVLAALSGLRIDNCEVHVDRAEMPGLDGSSQGFVDALLQTEIVKLDAPRFAKRVTQPLRVGDEASWIEAVPSDKFEIEYNLSYDCPSIGTQIFEAQVTPSVFKEQIAAARTFVLKSEADMLQQQGLGQRVTYQDILVFDETGPIENSIRFENECARHKLLDVIGDFALAGFDILGKFRACRSGHKLNSRMVFELLQQTSLGSNQIVDEEKIRISA